MTRAGPTWADGWLPLLAVSELVRTFRPEGLRSRFFGCQSNRMPCDGLVSGFSCSTRALITHISVLRNM